MTGSRGDFDPIEMELLHTRLLAVVEESARTIYRTAISPVITEGADYSATLLDPDGALIAGSGAISLHWLSATRAVEATIAKFGDDIGADDVYLSNDPYNGGGVHPSDVFMSRPIFVDGERVAWIVASAHMIDIGGMAVGSWAPAAAECYGESFRVPPTRVFRAGVENPDVFDIVRSNVRMADIVEMDMRSLIAATFVAQEKLQDLIAMQGVGRFLAGIATLRTLSRTELRRRLGELPEGTYRSCSWTQWGDQLLRVPCVLTLHGGKATFDFTGAAAQVPFFVNSQPYIVLSSFLSIFSPQYIPDLPYNAGVAECFELICTAGTVVNAQPPAPVGAGHLHVAYNVSESMLSCLRLAVAAADSSFTDALLQGQTGISGLSMTSWGGVGVDGKRDGWMFLEGTLTGAPGAAGSDGVDGHHFIVPTQGVDSGGVPPKIADIEIMESWHAILFSERRLQASSNGAGAFRAGAGVEFTFQPHGTDRLTGQMLGLRERIPLEGFAGGLPGARTSFLRETGDGDWEPVRSDQANVALEEGRRFRSRTGSGGGFGDPLDRVPARVLEDVDSGRLSVRDAEQIYGVILQGSGVDEEATVELRDRMRRDRLASASPPARPSARVLDQAQRADVAAGNVLPLFPGVVRYGDLAVAAASGSVLAQAPEFWADGCPTIEAVVPGDGPSTVVRSYLDPQSGRLLHVESVPAGTGRAFSADLADWANGEPHLADA